MIKAKNEEEPDEEGKVLLSRKTVYFSGNVTNFSTLNFVGALREADTKSGMITVLITSDGGWVEGGLTMSDAIKSVKNEVLTVGVGGVHSSAVLPFIAGDYRVMYPSTRMLLHDFSLNMAENTLTKLKNYLTEVDDLFNLYCDYVARDTGLNKDIVEELMKAETYLNSQRAMQLNFTDGIISALDKKKYNKVGTKNKGKNAKKR